jgi:hypothetical protein
MIQRAKKSNPSVRCCWVCGKLGGVGATGALFSAGYDVPRDSDNQFTVIAYAHPGCLSLALKRAVKRKAKHESH